MKLTDRQIDALAKEISEKISSHNKKLEATLYQKPENIAKAKEYCAIVNKIPLKIRKTNSDLRDVTPRSVLRTIVYLQANNPEFKKKLRKDVSHNELRRKIILATVDAKDLADLVKKLDLGFPLL